jgi:hypothetical protein
MDLVRKKGMKELKRVRFLFTNMNRHVIIYVHTLNAAI